MPGPKLLKEGFDQQRFGLEGKFRKPLDNFIDHGHLRCSVRGIESYAGLNLLAISCSYLRPAVENWDVRRGSRLILVLQSYSGFALACSILEGIMMRSN